MILEKKDKKKSGYFWELLDELLNRGGVRGVMGIVEVN